MTAGKYSEGSFFVVYEIRGHVLLTVSPPTTTHLGLISNGIKPLGQVRTYLIVAVTTVFWKRSDSVESEQGIC